MKKLSLPREAAGFPGKNVCFDNMFITEKMALGDSLEPAEWWGMSVSPELQELGEG